MTFLLQYTNPHRESVVPAFTIPGAHAPPAELEGDLHANVDGMAGDTTVLFGMFSDLFMETVADLNASRPTTNGPSHVSLLQKRIDELREQLQKAPSQPIELAVRGMLPKNSLGRQMLGKLKVYAGPEHPHVAQQPKFLEL